MFSVLKRLILDSLDRVLGWNLILDLVCMKGFYYVFLRD